jgi:hypothetical protein
VRLEESCVFMSRKWVRLFQWRLHAKRVALRKCGLRDLHRCGPRSAERQMYRLCEHERRRPPIWRGIVFASMNAAGRRFGVATVVLPAGTAVLTQGGVVYYRLYFSCL